MPKLLFLSSFSIKHVLVRSRVPLLGRGANASKERQRITSAEASLHLACLELNVVADGGRRNLGGQNSELVNLIIESDLGSPKATQHSSVMRASPIIGLGERMDCGVETSGQGNATIYLVTSNSDTSRDYPSLGGQSFSNLQNPGGNSAWRLGGISPKY